MRIAAAMIAAIVAFLTSIACHRGVVVKPQPVEPTARDIGIVIIQPGCARYPAPTDPDADLLREVWRVPARAPRLDDI